MPYYVALSDILISGIGRRFHYARYRVGPCCVHGNNNSRSVEINPVALAARTCSLRWLIYNFRTRFLQRSLLYQSKGNKILQCRQGIVFCGDKCRENMRGARKGL